MSRALTVHLSNEIFTSLERLAARTGKAADSLVEDALRQYAQNVALDQEIHEALVELEAGDFATDDEVKAVFDKWRRTG